MAATDSGETVPATERRRPTPSEAHEVYDVLVSGCGGKVWWNGGRVYVTCYPEHLNDEREVIIEGANSALAQVHQFHQEATDG